MNVLDSLKPFEHHRVIDLVEAAGVDVGAWARATGPAASNPAFCYDWSFIQPGEVVVLSLWHESIQQRDNQLWCDLNLREWAETGSTSTVLNPNQRASLSKRAIRMDNAMQEAFNGRLPVRAIIGQGTRRDIFDPKSKTASRMKLRLLDPEPWSVSSYSRATGECRLTRGLAPKFIDQYTAPTFKLPGSHEVTAKVWERSRKVRDAALLRSKGRCELCRKPGFRMVGGAIYLETHHVIPLSENGYDQENNVVAICPNDHREAHHGERREAIRSSLLKYLAKVYEVSN